MTMPLNLIFVRHGLSEANIMQKAGKSGDYSYYTDEVVTVPDRNWRLAPEGRSQAAVAGEYINSLFAEGFDRYIVSPYTRTRETAALLQLPDARWEENRVVRERSWGEIDSMSREEFKKNYPQNAIYKKKDPLYWRAPAGESIASVSEDRVRNLLGTLHRENSGQNVIAVTHGDYISSSRLTIERLSDEEYLRRDADPKHSVKNCTVLQYTRKNPETGEIAGKLSWVRLGWPVKDSYGNWTMEETPWEFFDREYLTNEELLGRAHLVNNWNFSQRLEGTQ